MEREIYSDNVGMGAKLHPENLPLHVKMVPFAPKLRKCTHPGSLGAILHPEKFVI